jgi:hypothetical protein
MTGLGIVAVLIVLLIPILIILKRRKKCPSCSSKETLISEPKFPEPEKQQPEIKPVEKSVVSAKPTVVNPQITDATVISSPDPKPIDDIAPSAKPEAVTPTEDNSSFPQDSILRRHFMTHLCTMLESVVPPRPTDSVLRRHYDAMIVTRIDQCLNDKKAMEQLLYAYENKKQLFC